MKVPLSIAVEPAKTLSATAEAGLLHDALTKFPASVAVRGKLGKVLNQLDRFAETIDLLSPALATLDSESALILAQACFALQDPENLKLAGLAADHARSTANSDRARARAMADQAKLQVRQGDSDAAINTLWVALALDRTCVAVFKRLATQLFWQGKPDAVERLTDDLIAEGVCHARVLAARTMALAAIGRDEEARAIVAIERHLHRAPLTIPAETNNLAQTNATLAAELTDSSALRRDRFGTASLFTGRLDAPSSVDTPLWTALLGQVARAAENWVNALPTDGHSWLAARPERAMLRSWCVITGAQGHERWHMHPDGWLSGGYYPQVPPGLGVDAETPGCIAFGLPAGLPGAEAANRFGELAVRPESGQLMLFPSHAYHRTYPHGKAAQRICIAFDIMPA